MHCNVFSSNKDSPTKSIEKSLFYVRRSKYKLSKKSFESRVEFIHFLRFATCHFFHVQIFQQMPNFVDGNLRSFKNLFTSNEGFFCLPFLAISKTGITIQKRKKTKQKTLMICNF